jgi:hypothetical protein
MTDVVPRWLNAEDTARYIGVRVDQLPRLLKAGKLPEPSRFLGPRQPRYDRLKIDALFNPEQPSVQGIVDAAVRAILAEGGRASRKRERMAAGPE